jgi:hypothetical protein
VYFSPSSLNFSEPLPFGVSGATTWLNFRTIGACADAGPIKASAAMAAALRMTFRMSIPPWFFSLQTSLA